jgi:hypothetical protein
MMIMAVILLTVFHDHTIESIIFIMNTKAFRVAQWVGLVVSGMGRKEGDSEVAWLKDIENLTNKSLKGCSRLILGNSRFNQRRTIGSWLHWVRNLTGDIGFKGRIRALRFRSDVDSKISTIPQSIGRVTTGFKQKGVHFGSRVDVPDTSSVIHPLSTIDARWFIVHLIEELHSFRIEVSHENFDSLILLGIPRIAKRRRVTF